MRRRNCAARDTIVPLGVHLVSARAECIHSVCHVAAGLSGTDPAFPCSYGVGECSKRFRNFSRGFVAELMTRHASIGLELAYPLSLTLHAFGNAVAVSAGAGKLVFPWNLYQREPVRSRIVIRRRFRARSNCCCEVQTVSRG